MQFGQQMGWIFPRKITGSYGKKEAHLPLSIQNRKRHCFPWSLTPGNSGTNGLTVEMLHCKIKRTQLMEEVRKVKRESDRHHGKTGGECFSVVSKSAPLLLYVSGSWDGSKPSFFPLNQQVTKPAFLLIQLTVLICLSHHTEFGEMFVCFFTLDSSKAAICSHDAKIVFAKVVPTDSRQGNAKRRVKVERFHYFFFNANISIIA